jgi:purine-cytosine permease-like protein
MCKHTGTYVPLVSNAGVPASRAEITPVEPDPGHAGEGSCVADTDTPSWGIEPVPERLRVLGFLDGFLLWSNLSVSLLVIVAGAFLVLPADQFGLALSLPDALGAIVAATLAGSVLLGLGGLIGADARVPAMVLMRAPLGRRGSYLPTGLNLLQCLGWAVFELIIIATGASALSQQVLGFGGVVFWKILFGAVATALALLGSVGFVRKYVRKFAIWVVIASLIYLCWWSLHGRHPVALWTAAAHTRSGPDSTSCSRRSSRGHRSSPTTRASHGRAAPASGAQASGTSSRRSRSSRSEP